MDPEIVKPIIIVDVKMNSDVRFIENISVFIFRAKLGKGCWCKLSDVKRLLFSATSYIKY